MSGADDSADEVAAYVTAASELLQMPLTPQRRTAVIAVMRRLTLFAEDVAGFELANSVEIAGIFVP